MFGYIEIAINVKKQVASYLVGYPLYRQHWLLFVSIHASIIPAG